MLYKKVLFAFNLRRTHINFGALDEYFGRFILRIPKSFHKQLAEKSKREADQYYFLTESLEEFIKAFK